MCRQAKYCKPKTFRVHMQSEWYGYGLQEIVRNAVSTADPLSALTLTSASC
jgi:hypothetical protein